MTKSVFKNPRALAERFFSLSLPINLSSLGTSPPFSDLRFGTLSAASEIIGLLRDCDITIIILIIFSGAGFLRGRGFGVVGLGVLLNCRVSKILALSIVSGK